ncbi:hypothetical protein K2D_37610 [Planctomycetes bacterium K2D]|uniref:PEP-CTERM protein-sorting domain-containing protein n=2 Tax=Botrimarina mediterranea TaxID=2528022 RepID=A0A518KCI5_9BACT|nr:hypothetical protein Spa11_37220 [Botrimarina mediterranea]QDV80137.1 hypothetical protein K2D_37610 [Planctomycetes bacterium K2D]
MKRCLLFATAALGCGMLFSGAAQGAELFRDEMASGAGWGVNANNADSAATFGYDYSADGIPEAPNSRGGDTATSGVKLEANISTGTLSVFTLYPTGQNFTGAYQLRFDVWTNYDVNERVNGASAGTTEFIGGGIGYNGTNADVGSGAQILATNEGGSASDWRAFADTTFLAATEMTAGTRNGEDAYYADFLTGVAPPASQSQVAFPPGIAGTPGFQWVTFEVTTDGSVADIWIEKPSGDRLQIVTIDEPFSSDGNISLVYADFFTSVTSRPDLTFGVIDNVEVSQIPEPTAIALCLLGAGVMLRRR